MVGIMESLTTAPNIKIKQKQISFYGTIWDENGAHSDPDKCDNIKKQTSTKKCQRIATVSWSCSISRSFH